MKYFWRDFAVNVLSITIKTPAEDLQSRCQGTLKLLWWLNAFQLDFCFHLLLKTVTWLWSSGRRDFVDVNPWSAMLSRNDVTDRISFSIELYRAVICTAPQAGKEVFFGCWLGSRMASILLSDYRITLMRTATLLSTNVNIVICHREAAGDLSKKIQKFLWTLYRGKKTPGLQQQYVLSCVNHTE